MNLTWWTYRRLATTITIVYMLFLSLFSLDAFGSNSPFWEQLLGFFIHQIPVRITLMVLLFAQKSPHRAGRYFLASALLSLVIFQTYRDLVVLAIITGPLVLIACLHRTIPRK